MRKNGLFPHQSKYFKVTVNLKGPICRKGQEQNDYVDRYHWNIYATIRERSVRRNNTCRIEIDRVKSAQIKYRGPSHTRT